jgi:hypothetical protein
MPLRLSTSAVDFETRFAGLLAMKREVSEEVNDVVRSIGQDVALRGDAALIEYTAKFDKLMLTPATLRVTEAQIEAALAAMTILYNDLLASIPAAAPVISNFTRNVGTGAVDVAGIAAGNTAEIWAVSKIDDDASIIFEKIGEQLNGGTIPLDFSLMANHPMSRYVFENALEISRSASAISLAASAASSEAPIASAAIAAASIAPAANDAAVIPPVPTPVTVVTVSTVPWMFPSMS